MPTYEYRCKECGEHLEVVQKFTDDPLTECPTCGGPLRKVFGNIGITFKGSGFYKTDSRSSSSSKKTESAGEKADTSSSSSSSSSDAGSSSSDTSPSKSVSSDSTSSSAPASKTA